MVTATRKSPKTYRYSPLSPATMHKAISTTKYPCRTRQAVYSYASVRVVSTAICP